MVASYYDREADIAYFELSEAQVSRSVEYEWGLLDVGDAGEVAGAECWNASARLPRELLQAMPSPPVVTQRR